MGGNGSEMNGIDEQNENIGNREPVNALIHSSSIINNCCNHVLNFSSLPLPPIPSLPITGSRASIKNFIVLFTPKRYCYLSMYICAHGTQFTS